MKTDLMLSVCKKGTRILKAYGGTPLNMRGEYLPNPTEVTRHQNLVSSVTLISTTTKLVRWFVVESAINSGIQNIVPRGNANQQHVAIYIFSPLSTVTLLDQRPVFASLAFRWFLKCSLSLAYSECFVRSHMKEKLY